MGGGGRLDERGVVRMCDAILNVMRHLGMLAGERSYPQPQQCIQRGHRLRPSVGGVLWNRVELLEHVSPGQIVQSITDLFGREKQEIVAPVEGVVIALRTCGSTNSGEYCSNVGELE